MGPPDGGFFPGSGTTATGPTGGPLKRAKVMRTTGTDIVTTATYPEFGSKASDPRHYHHGDTTGFTPITANLVDANVSDAHPTSLEKLVHNNRIPAGTVLCGSRVQIKGTQYAKWTSVTHGEMPLPIVNDAECRSSRMGKVTAHLTIAVEGRALINRNHLGDDCHTWKQGDKLYWKMPKTGAGSAWTLEKIVSKRHDALYHAILYNGLVGGAKETFGSLSTASGYVLVFIVAMP